MWLAGSLTGSADAIEPAAAVKICVASLIVRPTAVATDRLADPAAVSIRIAALHRAAAGAIGSEGGAALLALLPATRPAISRTGGARLVPVA